MTKHAKKFVTGTAALAIASVLAFTPASPSAESIFEVDEVCGLDSSGMPNCVDRYDWKCTHGENQWPDQCDPDVPETACEAPA